MLLLNDHAVIKKYIALYIFVYYANYNDLNNLRNCIRHELFENNYIVMIVMNTQFLKVIIYIYI